VLRIGEVLVPRSSILLALTVLALPSLLHAQERNGLGAAAAAGATTVAAGPKQALAIRVTDGSIQLDGALSDAAWQQTTPITDFVQKEPVEGAAPNQQMEVRFVFDSDALYVGARMYSDDPAAIQAPLGRRDPDDSSAEHIVVSLDTFLDRRTAYSFGVTAAGVRIDEYHGSDDEGGDNGFDPVWEARTRVDDQGWTAELWIPFDQLRFNNQDQQVWGLNVQRVTPTLEEQDYWVMVPRTEQGWASRFGDLRGIQGIEPSRRIELLPFVVGSSTMTGDARDPDDPFDDGRNLVGRMGLDLKMGVGPNLTLDATVNPDFGQVEADPAEVNLSDFETRFDERRPFFTEGADLLTLRHPNVFYSRRIGAPPVLDASGDYVDAPSNSQILGAAKLTGRLPSGTSLGVLAALTAEEHARVVNEDTPGVEDIRVGPRMGFGVFKVQQELGQSGSNASLLIGGVKRDLKEDDPLAELISDHTVVFGGDWLWRMRGGEYEWTGTVVGSHVAGDPAAIQILQESSAHYLQRPDREGEYRLDPTRESLTGWSIQTGFNRRSGEHWLFGLSTKIDHPMFDPQDIANLNGADGIQPNLNITYRETQPGSIFRSYSVRLSQGNEWNFEWDRQNGNVGTQVNLTWLNFWNTNFSFTRQFETRRAGLTRGGPLMGGPSGWNAQASIGNSSSSQTRWSANVRFAEDALGGKSGNVGMSISVRPGPRWELSVRPGYTGSHDAQQYITRRPGGREETYGNRYIFSYIERHQYSAEFRASFTVRPDLNLDVYAEPFAASGRYYEYGELSAPGSLDRIVYGEEGGSQLELREDGSRVVTIDGETFTLGNRDFNVRSFNTNVVLRWEWRPGSTLYLVWQQNRDSRETLATPVGVGDVFDSITDPGSNILLIKTSFWIPVG
jgi:hypothetical protein